MSYSANQKVTTDSATKDENPGIVASDSLAAESINDGGSFAANSASRGPMEQPSRSLNATTTDVSNATKLEPAPDAEARAAQEEWSENQQLNAASSLGSQSGVGSTYNSAVSGGFSDATTQGDNAAASSLEEYSRPKGQNLREGGFDSSAPNASYSTDIGGKNDPGRIALEKMEQDNVPVAGGAGSRQQGITGEGQFDSLGDTSA